MIEAKEMSANLRPLLRTPLSSGSPHGYRSSSHPVRIGEHDQTAFSARPSCSITRARNEELRQELIIEQARKFYLADKETARSPTDTSGEDFLSPVLE